MISQRSACPSPATLSREFSRQAEGGASLSVLAHLDVCPACQREWAAMTELRNLSRALPLIPTPATEHEEVRTALLLRSTAPGRSRTPRLAWLSIPIMGAAILAVLILPHSRTTRPLPTKDVRQAAIPTPAIYRARIHSDSGAAYTIERGQPDELVRLRHGSIVVDVEPLHPGERFRVTVQDAEIEVHGTVFQVVAQTDRLERVDVWRGLVVVRPQGRDSIELRAGQHWEQPDQQHAPPRPRQRRASAAPVLSGTESTAAAAEKAFGDGWSALRADNFAEAATAFDRAAATAGDQPIAEDASFWKAVCQARAGYPTTASASLAAFIARFPKSPRVGEASAMLGWLLIEQEDIEGARLRFAVAAKDRASNVRQSARLGLDEIERLRRQALGEGSERDGH